MACLFYRLIKENVSNKLIVMKKVAFKNLGFLQNNEVVLKKNQRRQQYSMKWEVQYSVDQK